MDTWEREKGAKLKLAAEKLRAIRGQTICDNIVSLAENYGPNPDDLDLPLTVTDEELGWAFWALGYIEGLCLHRKCTVAELFAAEGIDP